MENLISKYDRPGPRYTSYPPVPFWKGAPEHAKWLTHLRELVSEGSTIDLYLHIPFCEKLCYYCGCNRVISNHKDRADGYLVSLKTEWQHYLDYLGQDLKLNSLHLGGGTPTFLTPESMRDLLAQFAPYFADDFTGAIEVDPRTCTEEHLQVLREFRFTRISMGIQDFDPLVQQKINREQSFEMVEALVQRVRAMGFESLNFDLIYGLPGQTAETIAMTIEKVKELSPDLIAFYSYAHLPEKIKNQRLIKTEDLALGTAKRALYDLGKDLLEKNSYHEIGMDHFAKEDSFLWKKKCEGKLLRNFMGYTDRKGKILLGLGASSIGNTDYYFVQNTKGVKDYQKMVAEQGHAIIHGHELDKVEREISSVIQDIMCQGGVTLDLEHVNALSDTQWSALDEMTQDGLLFLNKNTGELKLTHLGMAFVRNVAMVFDPYMQQNNETRFSRTV